ncbi:MAG: CHAD domain-containing protein [Streptosporangiaceae bacterium]
MRPAGCAARRLRGALKSFRKVLGLPAATRLRAELAWPGDALGEARDNEVLASRLRTELARTPGELVMGPVQARVSAYFAPRAASAAGALQEALDSGRYIALLSDLDQALSGPLPGANVSSPATGHVSGLAAVPWARPGQR